MQVVACRATRQSFQETAGQHRLVPMFHNLFDRYVVLAGIVVKAWKYADDLPFRLAIATLSCRKNRSMKSSMRQISALFRCPIQTGLAF